MFRGRDNGTSSIPHGTNPLEADNIHASFGGACVEEVGHDKEAVFDWAGDGKSSEDGHDHDDQLYAIDMLPECDTHIMDEEDLMQSNAETLFEKYGERDIDRVYCRTFHSAMTRGQLYNINFICYEKRLCIGKIPTAPSTTYTTVLQS